MDLRVTLGLARKRRFCYILVAVVSVFLTSVSEGEEAMKKPIYVNFFCHFERSPIRGVPLAPSYSGEGPVFGSKTIKALVEFCEKYDFKPEMAMMAVFLQQLEEDYPEVIEKIKKMKMPITLYGGVGHAEPPPVGRQPQVDTSSMSEDEAQKAIIEATWRFETHTLVPNWRMEDGRVVLGNPDEGKAIEDKFGGVLAIEKILGVIPIPIFPPLFEGMPESKRFTPVQRALGMGSFVFSKTPGVELPVMIAPGGAEEAPFTIAPELQYPAAKYFGKGIGVDAPRRATTLEWLDSMRDTLPRDRGIFINFYITSGTPLWEGNPLRDKFDELLKYLKSHEDDFKIVWPDPEAVQWREENSAIAFLKKSYGVRSFEDMLRVPPPLDNIKTYYAEAGRPAESPGIPPRYARPRAPDFMKAAQHELAKETLQTAAHYLLQKWPATSHDADFGGPPYYIELDGGKYLSLAQAFQGFAKALVEFSETKSLPASVSTTEILGPIDYPMYELEKEPQVDRRKYAGGYLPRELDMEYFPDQNTVNSQGLPPMGTHYFHMPTRTIAEPEDIFYSASQAIKFMEKEGHVPSVIPVWMFTEDLNVLQPSRPSKAKISVNAAEFLYAMAEEYWAILQHDAARSVMMVSMKIIAPEQAYLVIPATPLTPHVYQNEMATHETFVWREKVTKYLLNAAWTYVPGS